jgi:hypothetical protein
MADMKVRGVIRKLGIEGGLWALMGDDGVQYHLLSAPAALKQDGAKVEVEGDEPGGASIGMVGSTLEVRSFKVL